MVVTIMTTSASSSLKLARNRSTYVFRIEGRGTIRESKAFQTLAEDILETDDGLVTLDLSACNYLDSTFLGSIAILHRRFGQAKAPRFVVHAARSHCRSLFGPTHLDTIVSIAEQLPSTIGDFEEVEIKEDAAPSLGRHVMHCHQRLAEIDSPHQQKFAAIAQRLEDELSKE